MVGVSNGGALAMAIAKSQPFENRTIQNLDFVSGFQIVFDKMSAICPDFKWITDPIRNPDHLKPNLFWTIQNPV